jgi:hypothetical protein
VYEASSLNQPGNGSVKVIEEEVLEKERREGFELGFELGKTDRFRCRTR